MTKHYEALCSKCSTPDAPEFREFVEEEDHLQCLNCKHVLVIVKGNDGKQYLAEVE